MSSDIARSSDTRRTLPRWKSVLAVVAHPDDESFGLGAVVNAFVARGSRVSLLCLTEGERSTVGAGINLGRMRREELDAASRELGVAATVMHHHPDGDLRSVCRHVLAGEVVDEVGVVHAEGLLVFDSSGVTGHPDHVAATAAALQAAEVLDLPVLAWTIPATVAGQLNAELAGSGNGRFSGRPAEDIDLEITVDRAHQVAASRAHHTQAVPTSPLWRRLELLGDKEHLRWLRRPASDAGPGLNPGR
jgi:LmbE family N-acetylglucosaminyl deacetylase